MMATHLAAVSPQLPEGDRRRIMVRLVGHINPAMDGKETRAVLNLIS